MSAPLTPDEHWDLWRRDPRATPFQSPAWQDAWWAELGGGERVDLIARNAAGRAIAALPAFIWVDEGIRKLVPVGAGHSDYLDALVDPDAGEGAIAALWAAAAAVAERSDVMLLRDLRPDSPLLGALPAGWTAEDGPADVCPVLDLPAGTPLDRIISKSHRRKVGHDRLRAEKAGPVDVRLAGPTEIPQALDALFTVHGARWAAEGQAGVLADPRVQAFHRRAAPALHAAGLLRLAVVRHVGEIVAVLLGLADARRRYSYINGVAFTPGQSYGTLAFEQLIAAAVEEAAEAFHFLRGEEPYKYRWGARPVATVTRVVRRS